MANSDGNHNSLISLLNKQTNLLAKVSPGFLKPEGAMPWVRKKLTVTQYQNPLLFYSWIVEKDTYGIRSPNYRYASWRNYRLPLPDMKIKQPSFCTHTQRQCEQTLLFPNVKNTCKWARLTFSSKGTQTRRW